MVDSTFAAIAFCVILGIVLFFVNPVIALVPLLIVVALVGLRFGAGLFKNAGATPNRDEGVRVPSTREASYEPVSDPGERT